MKKTWATDIFSLSVVNATYLLLLHGSPQPDEEQMG